MYSALYLLHFDSFYNSVEKAIINKDQVPPIFLKRLDSSGKNMLMLAIEKESFHVATQIMQLHPDMLQSKCKKGITPLMKACELGNMEIVEFGLKHQKDAFFDVDNDGLSPAGYIIKRGHEELFNLLVNEHRDMMEKLISIKKSPKFLYMAFKYANEEILKNIWNSFGHVLRNEVDAKGNNWAHYACTFGNRCLSLTDQMTIEELLTVNKDGQSPIFMAAKYNQDEFIMNLPKPVQRRLANGMDFDNEGYSVFTVACKAGSLKAAIATLSFLKSPYYMDKDKWGMNGAMYAVMTDDFELVELYLAKFTQRGFIEVLNNEGKSAFMMACNERKYNSIRAFFFYYSDLPSLFAKVGDKYPHVEPFFQMLNFGLLAEAYFALESIRVKDYELARQYLLSILKKHEAFEKLSKKIANK
ncbi:hypothetical protein O9G_005478 [Rozella allomycis CSF55]|uniref:Uncharacterized protein n=1 Tax=Rozella allomycis (strain CSF55) TaxID=988480 RepID=A0A075B276_ROZAC|nr:hypothetical protein O9G_005478 [Rozella allomycis CSF55]|eukprot:EPZ36617.1 hypothetical protein O9G_005478 [Rozella allomycis CSF55]